MGWFSDIFDKITGKKVQVKVASGNKSPLLKSKRSKIEETPDEIQVDKELESLIEDFMEPDFLNIFFDPEEEHCYIYLIDEAEAIEKKRITREEWTIINPQIKKINQKIAVVKGKKFLAAFNMSLTNLGERITLILLKPQAGREALKSEKRNMIKAVNRLKPATALTHKNIESLIDTIKSCPGKPAEDIFKLFVKDEMLTKYQAEMLRKTNDFITLLKSPFPRKMIVQNVSKWLGVSYFDVEINEYDKRFAKRFPEEILKKLNVLIYEGDEEKVKAAFGNPFDIKKVKQIEEITGKKVEVNMACDEDIRYELEKIYQK